MSEIDTSRDLVEEHARILDLVRALFTRCETAERERDEALVALGEQKLCDCGEDDMCQIVREREEQRTRADAAEAAVGVLREALREAAGVVRMACVVDEADEPDLVAMLRKVRERCDAALTSTAASAAARDARLREEGRREGIEEAAGVADYAAHFGPDQAEQTSRDIASVIRALLDKPAARSAGEDGR